MLKQLAFKKATTSDLDTIISIQQKSFKDLYKKYHDEDTNPDKASKSAI